jgi:uncharacterized Zn-binding protein involved in type VI secretion
MPPAARVGDPTSHASAAGKLPGAAGSAAGALTVPTGSVGTPSLPGLPSLPIPGSVGAPLLGVTSVLIGGKPAAVIGTLVICGVHPYLGPGNLAVPKPGPGSLTGQVLIGGFPAARAGDMSTCGATIVGKAPDVLIGGA